MTGPNTPKHELETLNRLEAERGKINWNEVADFYDGAPPDLKQQIAELLTGNMVGQLNLDDPNHQLLVYYAYLLNRDGKIDVFTKTYKDRFEKTKATVKPAVSLPAPAEITGPIRSYKGATKPESKDAALADLGTKLGNLEFVADHYGVALPVEVSALVAAADLATLIQPTAYNLAALQRALLSLYGDIQKAEKAAESRITARPVGAIAVYQVMKAEHVGLGKSDIELETDTAEDFSIFAVRVTSEDFKGLGVTPTTGVADALEHDLKKLGAAAKEFAQRQAANTILAEFPMCKGLHVTSTPQDINGQLKEADPVMVARLILLLRHEVAERSLGRLKGVKEKDLTDLQAFVYALEDLLSKRMAAEIFPEKSDAKEAWKRVPGVTNKYLRKPSREDPKDIHKELHKYEPPKPKEEKHGHGAVEGLLSVGAVAAIIASVNDFLRMTGLQKFFGGGKATEPPAGKPDDHGKPKAH